MNTTIVREQDRTRDMGVAEQHSTVRPPYATALATLPPLPTATPYPGIAA